MDAGPVRGFRLATDRRPAAEADSTRSKGRSFLNIRGELVPFLRLRELFDEPGEPDAHQKVVIVAAFPEDSHEPIRYPVAACKDAGGGGSGRGGVHRVPGLGGDDGHL